MRSKAAFMFELQNRIILVLYSHIALAKNIRQLVAPPSLTEFSIGPIVQYKQGVDKVLKQAEAAGTVVTEEPHERPSTQDTLNVLMIICGKLFGILVGKPKTEGIF